MTGVRARVNEEGSDGLSHANAVLFQQDLHGVDAGREVGTRARLVDRDADIHPSGGAGTEWLRGAGLSS